MPVHDFFPRKLPDLLPGRPVIVTGRFQGTGPVTLRITGRSGSPLVEEQELSATATPTAAHSALPILWARFKLSDLFAEAIKTSNPSLELKRIALDYGLLSPYTAFLTVDTAFPGQIGPAEPHAPGF